VSVTTWLNSIQSHMLGLTLCVVGALTAISLIIFNYADPPARETVSLYEMARVARELPLAAKQDGSFAASIVRTSPEMPSESERVIARLLANKLGLPAANVRVSLSRMDRIRSASFVREVRLYGEEEAGSPILFDAFDIAVRLPDGSWQVHRRFISPLRPFYTPGMTTVYMGLLLMIPLTLWVSTRISRPIKAFAAAANRLGASIGQNSVPISGPTEIRVAAAALNEMQARITRSVVQRTAVVAAMAHDLRTPLNSLRFQIASAPERLRETAEADILMMERMISSSLDFVDSEVRPMRSELIDLGTLLESLTDEFGDLGNDVSFAQTQRMTVQGDLILLRRLFGNLLGNAVKFANHTDVKVEHERDEAVITIQDDGPGIPSDEIPRVLEPFFRGERSRNRETGGFGLGLAIVKTAVDAHGASLLLENAPEGGLRARVRIRAHLSAIP